jgi:deoxycytidine triphosphate deaminase
MTDQELPEAYRQYKSTDPFPEIQPALLNSADIADYVAATSMVVPFDNAKLKPASYEIPFSGDVFWWDVDTKRKRVKKINSKDDPFILKSNGIAYVHPDTTFYLPDYIAMRFNLRITHVHQGLLLGTGPLVDPGFCGRLLIPLHNMTTNEYNLVYGNGLIWVEFTKLSPNARWMTATERLPRAGSYTEFPANKRFLEPDFYIQQAAGERQIVSSIPTAVAESRAHALAAAGDAKVARSDADSAAQSAGKARDDATKAVARLDSNLIIGLAIGLVAIAIAAYATYVAVIQVFQNTMDSKSHAIEEVVKAQVESLQREMTRLREEMAKAAMGEGKKPVNSDGKKK